MKTLELNKNSSHYKLANLAHWDDYYYEKDLCSYMKFVLGGFFVLIFYILLFFAISYCTIDLLLAIGFSITYGRIIFGDVAVIVSIILSVLGFSVALIWLVENLKMSNKPKIFKQGFVYNSYKSLSQKYCMKIEFKE